MSDFAIYSDFSHIIKWIVDQHREESLKLPNKVFNLADFYLRERLLILNHKPLKVDVRFGMPIPYLALWFADAFNISDPEIIKKIAIGMTYISLSCSVRDDLVDNKYTAEHEHICLADIYYNKYLETFKNTFGSASKIWHILSESSYEWNKYESWSYYFSFTDRVDSLSEFFLEESSRYLAAITFPSIAALAIIGKNSRKITRVKNFLRHYWMGWKIVDDMRDWHNDIKKQNFNHSCILYSARNKFDNARFNEEAMLSTFLSKSFIRRVYDTVTRFYLSAKDDVSTFKSDYLNRFIDNQISFHNDERKDLINIGHNFYHNLERLTAGIKQV